MKFFIFFFLPLILWSQKKENIQSSKDSLQAIIKLNYKKTIDIDDIQIKFKKVISDSRCPIGVQCVWAGEAKVLLGIKSKKLCLEKKEITINSKNVLNDGSNLIYASERIKIYATGLYPHPVSPVKNDFKKYYLEFSVLHID